MAILETVKLTKAFGGVMAVHNVDFSAERGEIVAIIGPNGAGKTTFFNLVTGVIPLTSGEVRFDGRPIHGFRPHQIASMGISRTFQNLQLFHNMTVLENVMVGCHRHGSAGLLSSMLRLPRARREDEEILERAQAKLEKVGLGEFAGHPCGSLPFGKQRLLEIARALALEPVLLLLDEPAAGLNREETRGLVRLIFDLRDEGLTVILVEHDMDTVMGVADRIMVLDYGEKIAEGTPAEIQADKRVIAAYLGEEGVA